MWPLSCCRATKLEYFQRFSPPTTMFSPVADQSSIVKHGGTPAGSDPAVLAWLLQIFSILLRAKLEGLVSVDVHNSYCADTAYGKLDCTNAAITLSRQTPRFDFSRFDFSRQCETLSMFLCSFPIRESAQPDSIAFGTWYILVQRAADG